jgi:type IV secretion system protein VirB4
MSTSALSKASALRRESAASKMIPYTSMASESLVRTTFGDFVQVFELRGVSFENADAAYLNALHERLNVLWRNIASTQVAVWTHLVRDRCAVVGRNIAAASRGGIEATVDDGFGTTLEHKYRARLAGEKLMSNRLYLSLVYRPIAGPVGSALGRLLLAGMKPPNGGAAATVGGGGAMLADALDACAKLRRLVGASLADYEPRLLDVHKNVSPLTGTSIECAPLSFLGELINGERQKVALPRAALNEVLATARLTFGTEVIEYRGATRTRWGAMLGIKEYPASTEPGVLNRLLAAPYPLVLTQSFAFLSKGAAQGLLTRQFNQMSNAGDFAVSQADALKDALDAVASNEFVMGDHHCSLQILSDSVDAAAPLSETDTQLKRLNDSLAAARGVLGDAGITTAREDLAIEAAFWAQLPGQFALRPRKAAISSRNFAGLASFHGYPSGREHGNHWGEALATLVTAARSPFHFSLHASDPREADGGSRRDLGHTLICGPSGSGKTVFIGFLLTLLARRGVTQVVFDKDRGLEILVRALGGEYLALPSGSPTGFNPLALEPTPSNVEFLRGWLLALLEASGPSLTVVEREDVAAALAAVMEMPADMRRLSRVIEYLDATRAEGPHARLARWCEVAGGELAWVFDNPSDLIVPLLSKAALVGFDVTEFLDHAQVRGPATRYLFYLVRQLVDGRKFVCWLDEFWRLLADEGFREFAKDGPKTWRKLNAVMCLATQSASDVIGSPIARTLIEQTATKVFFPNIDATRADYCEGFSLSEREFELIAQELTPGSRRFVLRQGRDSVVCELDLKGFDDELAVISGRAREVALMNRLRVECGDDPSQWLRWFLLQRHDEANARS